MSHFRRVALLAAPVVLIAGKLWSEGAQTSPQDDAAAAMKRAATYYRTQVAVHGGYVYHYTLDLETRWGEGLATKDQIWVQPPATPTVGMAYLAAYRATKDAFYLDAARETAEALVYGQLKSGGWRNVVAFDPQSPRLAAYRNGKGRNKGDNNSTFDDGISQSATRFLALADEALEFKHAEIHEAARVALDALLAAQFPNGAFPQVWTGPVATQPVLAASYPDYDWRTEGRIKEYWDRYTLNDGVAGYVADVLIEAHRVYKDDRYKAALVRLGDFLVLAQMPDPQPAWCQQYGFDMKPIWARKFEPPAVSGGESQDVLETLLKIYRLTGDKKYAAPIPRALAYLKRSLLPDGRLARYYELQSNKPLYMTRNGDRYLLTYDDTNLPDHYGWKVDSRLTEIEIQFGYPATQSREPMRSEDVQRVVGELDAEGRWVSTFGGERLVGQPKFAMGDKYLSSAVFARNLTSLAESLSRK
jgi:PelA/Pel-15E family pectate lyase